MVRRFLLVLALTISLLTISSPVFAHHGNAAYDETKPVKLNGTVTKFFWANPHTQIYFDVKDSKGNVVHWWVETLSPGKLAREGWAENAIKPGDQVIITLSPAKDGTPKGFLKGITFRDGRQLGMLEHPQ